MTVGEIPPAVANLAGPPRLEEGSRDHSGSAGRA